MNADVSRLKQIVDAKQIIIERLDEICRAQRPDDTGEIRWDDAQVVRKCAIQLQRGNPDGWRDFISHLSSTPDAAWGFVRIFENLGWAKYSVEYDCWQLALPQEMPPLDATTEHELTSFLNPSNEIEDDEPNLKQLGVIMYIEEKPGLAGHARIGRVQHSATRKTIYYAGRKLQSLKGAGYKANYFDVDSGLEYWISNCKRDGNDTLYPGIVHIDDDARIEYWTTIRKMPENVDVTRFRSKGKYAKRRPS